MLDMPTIFVLLLIAIAMQVISLALACFFTYKIDVSLDEIRQARIENALLRERQDMILRLMLPTTQPMSHYAQDTEVLNRIDIEQTAKFPAFHAGQAGVTRAGIPPQARG